MSINDDKKCAIACAHEDAVNIFQVNPTRSDYHNNELANHEMDTAVRLYLNLPVYAEEVKCPFCSKGILDVAGMHAYMPLPVLVKEIVTIDTMLYRTLFTSGVSLLDSMLIRK